MFQLLIFLPLPRGPPFTKATGRPKDFSWVLKMIKGKHSRDGYDTKVFLLLLSSSLQGNFYNNNIVVTKVN